MKISKKQLVVWILSFLPLILTAAAYSILPETIPMNWDFGGQVGYEPKWHLWIIAGLSPVLALLFTVLPHFDPKRKNYNKFPGSYTGFQLIMMLFMSVMTGICIVEGLRPHTLNVAMTVCLLLSLMFVYVGNVMPKFRMNWFCGIKNPWTLSNEEIWTRTHRLGGRLFFAAGLIGLAGAFVPSDTARFILLLLPLLAASLVPTVFSYIWFRERERQEAAGIKK